MARPDGVSDAEWEEILEKKAEQRLRDASLARVEREGFEMNTDDPSPSDVCWNRKHKRRGRSWKHEFCGAKPVAILLMASPDNPEGIRVPLCRQCLAEHIKSLVGILEIFT